MRAFVRVFALQTAIADSSHVHWQQNECTGMPERRSILWYNFSFGQTLKNAKLLGLPKAPDK
jgi:hypothetical protein